VTKKQEGQHEHNNSSDRTDDCGPVNTDTDAPCISSLTYLLTYLQHKDPEALLVWSEWINCSPRTSKATFSKSESTSF